MANHSGIYNSLQGQRYEVGGRGGGATTGEGGMGRAVPRHLAFFGPHFFLYGGHELY